MAPANRIYEADRLVVVVARKAMLSLFSFLLSVHIRCVSEIGPMGSQRYYQPVEARGK